MAPKVNKAAGGGRLPQQTQGCRPAAWERATQGRHPHCPPPSPTAADLRKAPAPRVARLHATPQPRPRLTWTCARMHPGHAQGQGHQHIHQQGRGHCTGCLVVPSRPVNKGSPRKPALETLPPWRPCPLLTARQATAQAPDQAQRNHHHNWRRIHRQQAYPGPACRTPPAPNRAARPTRQSTARTPSRRRCPPAGKMLRRAAHHPIQTSRKGANKENKAHILRSSLRAAQSSLRA